MSIYNLGTVFMMAYAFLVIPKESIEKNKMEVSSNDINTILDKIRIECNENNGKLESNLNIIRHIRNSIAHVNFDINPDQDEIIFCDEYNGHNTFRGSIQISDFISFLSTYYKTYFQNYHKKYIVGNNK